MFRIVFLFLFLSFPAMAQTVSSVGAEADQSVVPAADPFGRETPQGTATGLLATLVAKDRSGAASFLDLSLVGADPDRIAQAIDAFGIVLDRKGGLLPRIQLSSDPAGTAGTGLPRTRTTSPSSARARGCRIS